MNLLCSARNAHICNYNSPIELNRFTVTCFVTFVVLEFFYQNRHCVIDTFVSQSEYTLLVNVSFSQENRCDILVFWQICLPPLLDTSVL